MNNMVEKREHGGAMDLNTMNCRWHEGERASGLSLFLVRTCIAYRLSGGEHRNDHSLSHDYWAFCASSVSNCYWPLALENWNRNGKRGIMHGVHAPTTDVGVGWLSSLSSLSSEV